MGVHVLLEIVPQRIDPDAWAEAFDDTLRLLEAHPSRLMGFDWRTVAGLKLAVYTRSIERDAGDPAQRCWSVIGDRESLRRAECQTLYRDLGRYLPRASSALEIPQDILLYAAEHASDGGCGPVPVFANKTEGEPYHIPVLAAAMVIESRFPLHAMVHGDVDRAQAEAARAWAESVLERPVLPPVRVDAPRLIERLRRHLEQGALLQAFDRLCLDERKHEALFAYFPRPDAEAWWLAELERHEEPDSVGAGQLLMAYLNATGDLARLCKLCCLDPRGPRYEHEALVLALANRWVAIPVAATEFLDILTRPPGQAPTVASLLGGALLDLEGAGRHLATRFEMGAIEHALGRCFGAEAPRLVAMLRRRTADIEAMLAEPRDTMASFLQCAEQDASDSLEDLARLASPGDLPERWREDVRGLAFLVNHERRELQRDSKRATLLYGDAATTRHRIATLLARRGPTLTEDAWDWILREDDLDVLHFLATVAAMGNGALQLAHLRRAMLENAPLCRYAVRASQDEALMAEVGETVRAHALPPRPRVPVS